MMVFNNDEYNFGADIRLQTYEICLAAVRKNGLNLEYVKIEQTDELCYEAIAENPFALEYVKNQTLHMCFTAVKKCPESLSKVREDLKTFELCKFAILNDPEFEFRTDISNNKYIGRNIRWYPFHFVKEEYKHNIVSMLINSTRYNNYLYNIGMHLKYASNMLIDEPRIEFVCQEDYSLSHKRLYKKDQNRSYSIKLIVERQDPIVQIKNISIDDIKVSSPKIKSSSSKILIQHIPNDALRKICEFLVPKVYVIKNIDVTKMDLTHWINYYKQKIFDIKISKGFQLFDDDGIKVNNLEPYFHLDEEKSNIDIDYTMSALSMILA